jgi:hypothetical protein
LYEQLRSEALASQDGNSSPGLAVFLLKGMCAWMRVWSLCMQRAEEGPTASSYGCPSNDRHGPAPEPSGEQFVEEARIPADVRAQIVGILAQIILGQYQEVPL